MYVKQVRVNLTHFNVIVIQYHSQLFYRFKNTVLLRGNKVFDIYHTHHFASTIFSGHGVVERLTSLGWHTGSLLRSPVLRWVTTRVFNDTAYRVPTSGQGNKTPISPTQQPCYVKYVCPQGRDAIHGKKKKSHIFSNSVIKYRFRFVDETGTLS